MVLILDSTAKFLVCNMFQSTKQTFLDQLQIFLTNYKRFEAITTNFFRGEHKVFIQPQIFQGFLPNHKRSTQNVSLSRSTTKYF